MILFHGVFPSVSEVVQTLQLSADKDQTDVVGDLSVCLDGMQVDPEMFASAAEANNRSASALCNVICTVICIDLWGGVLVFPTCPENKLQLPVSMFSSQLCLCF